MALVIKNAPNPCPSLGLGSKVVENVIKDLKKSYYYDKMAVKLFQLAVKLFQIAVTVFQNAVIPFQFAVKLSQLAVKLFQLALKLLVCCETFPKNPFAVK